jgi:hypothetical protein
VSDDALSMWTVYDRPRDYPEQIVARRFEVSARGPRATDEIVVADSLDAIREWMVERGLTCLTRSPDDDSKIVETWL